MSEVASLENCKRLYELSGWETNIPYDWGVEHQQSLDGLSKKVIQKADFYLYSAGYLLRKLPNQTKLRKAKTMDRYWAYFGNNDKRDSVYADTPEDALALLAIKLFESGVLKKEGRDE